MIWENLFETVLLEPARQDGDELYIVSGYATATMVSRHIQELKRLNRPVTIQLIIGMAVQDGISQKHHVGFKELVENQDNRFTCRYVAYTPPVHSKLYAWYSNGQPQVAFVGSANYTQQAFGVGRRELMSKDDAQMARMYFDLTLQDTIDCIAPQIENHITVYKEPEYSIGLGAVNGDVADDDDDSESLTEDQLSRLPHVRVNLLDNHGRLPQRSGLNWGQRPEYEREPNQAYIRLPMSIAKTDFFPPRGEVFTILTDDDKPLICARAQDGGKAIHTTQNNSIIGIYFRYRLNIAEGDAIPTQRLHDYGRTDVDFYKIDEETFYMDFLVR